MNSSNIPLLTATIFTYNHGNSIEKCIQSILFQNTKYPYVIHIWDDHSLDDTEKICSKYAKNYPDKIKYFRQKRNTFTLPYRQMQAYQAIRNIKTKYWCMIDGDDWWCDENKIQNALDFLENHPEYIGFAHDTNYVEGNNPPRSYVHDILGIKDLPNKIELSIKTPYLLLISSRIFRNIGYAKKDILPIDYQMYYYHLSKGPIYYKDKPMANYNITPKSTFARKPDLYLVLMQPYKIMQLLDYKYDEFCSYIVKEHIKEFGWTNKRYNKLIALKKIFGVKLGWNIWFFITFVHRYGLKCLSLSFIYSDREQTKQNSDRTVLDDVALTEKTRAWVFKMWTDQSVLRREKTILRRQRNFILIVLALSLILNIIFILK